MSDPNKLKPGSYIDTQGMGGPMTPEDLAKWKASPEYKKRLKGAYDDVKPLPPSNFDTEHFKHYVGEEEPFYQDWSQE